MSQTTPNPVIVLQKPSAGVTSRVPIPAGATLKLDFAKELGTFADEGSDIVISFDDGATLVLAGFMNLPRDSMPNFEDAGELIGGVGFMESLGIKLAAGPARPTRPQGSGVGDYDDDGGALVNTVDKLGSLPAGLLGWSNATGYAGRDLSSDPSIIRPLLDISIDEPFGAGLGGSTVNEAHLSWGTDPKVEGAISSTWEKMQLPEGVRIAGMPSSGEMVIQHPNGFLTIRDLGNGLYEYSFTLTSPITTAGDNERGVAIDAIQVTFPITDGTNSGTASVVIDVIDDVPEFNTANTGHDGQETSAYAITGHWEVNFGADGPRAGDQVVLEFTDANGNKVLVEGPFGQPLDVIINGTFYGTIIINTTDGGRSGTYEFRTPPNFNAQLTMKMGAYDSEGDLTLEDTGVTLNIAPPSLSFVLGSGQDEWFSEANIIVDPSDPDSEPGTAPDVHQGTKEIGLPQGYTVDVSAGNWVDQGSGIWRLNGDNGYLLYDQNANRLTYTLTSGAEHLDASGNQVNEVFDFFTGENGKVMLEDWAGNNVEVPIQITIRDDAPIVELTGEGDATSGVPYEGSWKALFGGDGANDNDPLLITVKKNGTELDVEVPVQVGVEHTLSDGSTILLNPDGSFVFTAPPNTDAQYEINLGATDSDNDTSWAKDGAIVIDVNPPVGPPSSQDIYLKDGAVLDEAFLPNGTKAGQGPLEYELVIPKGYSIYPDATDGWVETPTNSGIWHLPFGGANDDSALLVYDANNNTLKVQLVDSFYHGNQDSLEIIIPDLDLADQYGNVFPDKGTVVVEVLDDDPDPIITVDDPNVLPGDTITGGWDPNPGADGLDSIEVIIKDSDGNVIGSLPVGEDGTGGSINVPGVGDFEFKDDGTYTFKPDDALKGEDIEIVIVVKDGEGNPTEAPGTGISVIDPMAGGEVIDGGTVSESNLPNGTDPDPNGLFSQIPLPDGGWVVDPSQGGWTEDPSNSGIYTKDSPSGTLTWDDNNKELTYELKDSHDHTKPGNDKAQDVFEDIVITRPIPGGGYEEKEIDVKVTLEDDVPEASMTGKTNEVTSGYDFEGKWDVEFGADGPKDGKDDEFQIEVKVGRDRSDPIDIKVGQPADVIVKGENYGTITFNDDGTYVFTPKPNTEGSLSISIIAEDGDGDITKSPGFTINVNPPADPGISHIGQGTTADESNFPGGTNPDPSALVKEVAVPPGYTVDTSTPGWVDNQDGSWTMTSPDGNTLTWDGDKLLYELKNPMTHGSDGRDTGQDSFPNKVTIVDEKGNTFEYDVKLNVVDDVPEPDLAIVGNDHISNSGDACTGTWDANPGADGYDGNLTFVIRDVASGKEWTATFDPSQPGQDAVRNVTIDGVFVGHFSARPDGTFLFRPYSQAKGQYDVILSVTDTDGDTGSSTTTSIWVISGDDTSGPGISVLTTDNPLDEANFDNGTAKDTSALVQTLNLPAGWRVDTTGWSQDDVGQPFYMKMQYGTLVYDAATGILTYTLQTRVTNDGSNQNQQDDFGYDILQDITIYKADNPSNTYELDAIIKIMDDAPIANVDVTTAPKHDSQGNPYYESGASITGAYDYQFGADGSATKNPIMMTVTDHRGISYEFPITVGVASHIRIGGVDYGQITLEPGGTFTFVPAPNQEGKLSFELAVTDKDGDKTTDNFELTVVKPEGPGDGWTLKFKSGQDDLSESYLPGGTKDDQATPDSLVREFEDLPAGFTLDTTGWTEDNGKYVKEGEYGKLVWDPVDEKLYYVLEKPAQNEAQGVDSAKDIIDEIVLKDANNNTYTGKAEAEFFDDMPVGDLATDQTQVTMGDDITGSLEFDFGADGPATDGKSLVMRVTNDNGDYVDINLKDGMDVTVKILGKTYGTLTYDEATGTYTFTTDPNQKDDISLSLVLKDSDGDVVVLGPKHVDIQEPDWPVNPEPIGSKPGEQAEEQFLPNGTHQNSSSLTKELSFYDESTGKELWIDTSTGWADANGGIYLKYGSNGYLTYDSNTNKLTYTLTDRATHTDPNASGEFDKQTDDFKIVLKNDKGTTKEVDAKIQIWDDAPELETNIVSRDEDASGNYIYNGTFDVEFGADDAYTQGGVNGIDLEVVITVYETDANGNIIGQHTVTIAQDMPTTFGTIVLTDSGVTYGKLVFTENPVGSGQGTYTFTPEPGVYGQYTINLGAKDSEGDHSTANDGSGTTITILPPVGGANGAGTVHEAALDEGSDKNWLDPSGTTPPTKEAGSTFTLPKGITVDGVPLDGSPKTFDSSLGTLTVWYKGLDGDGKSIYEYSYELKVAHHDSNSVQGPQLEEDLFQLKVNGSGNAHDTVDLNIKVVDDVPTAEYYKHSGGAEGTHEGDVGVIPGADGLQKFIIKVQGTNQEYDVTGATESSKATIIGEFGTMQVWKDSSGKWLYSYKANSGLDPDDDYTDSFTFIVTDGDGDTSTLADALEFTVTGDIVIGGSNGAGTVWEKNLSDGTDPNTPALTTPWTEIVITDDSGNPVGYSWSIKTGTFDDGRGILVIQDKAGGGYEYQYTLKDNFTHADGQGVNDIKHSFKVTVTNEDNGEEYDARFDFIVKDDVPQVEFDIIGSDFKSGHSYELDWGINHGADGQASSGYSKLVVTVLDNSGNPTSVSFTFADGQLFNSNHDTMSLGNYGNIVWNSGSGKWEFQAASNVNSSLKFELSGTDFDKDTITDSMIINVNKPTPPPITNIGDEDSAASESYLPGDLATGQAPGSLVGGGSTTIKLDTKGYSVDVDNDARWVPQSDGTYRLEGSNGYLTWSPNAASDKLTYTLTKSATHDRPTNDEYTTDTGIGKIILEDNYGNTWEVNTAIRIQDDVPLVSLGISDQVPSTGYFPSGAGVNGAWSINHGADGEATTDHSQFKITNGADSVTVDINSVAFGQPIALTGASGTNLGTIVFNSNGTFVYTPPANVTANYTLSVIGTDSDGDMRESTVGNVPVQKPGWIGPITLEPINDEPVYESGLPGGTSEGSATTSQELDLPAGYKPLVVDGSGNTLPQWNQTGPGVYEYVNNDGTAKLVWNDNTGKLSYVLTGPFEHEGGDGPSADPDYKDNITDVFDGFKLTDQYGNTYDMSATVDVADDVPVSEMGTPSGGNADNVNSGAEYTGGYTVDFGADGAGQVPTQVKVTVGGETKTFTVGPNGTVVITLGTPPNEVTYGTLKLGALDADGKGTFIFDSEPNLAGTTVKFQLFVQDSDGDTTVSSEFGLYLKGSTTPPVGELGTVGDEDFKEAHLPDGTEYTPGQSAGLLIKVIEIPTDSEGRPFTVNYDGWTSTSSGYTKQGAYGYLTYDPSTNKLTYTLTTNPLEAGAGNNIENDSIDVILQDYLGNDKTPIPVVVDIVDDVPEVTFGPGSQQSLDAGDTYTGDWAVHFGADGPEVNAKTLSLKVSVDGGPEQNFSVTVDNVNGVDIILGTPPVNYGKLVLDSATGKYTFKANANVEGKLTFKLGATDSDGDLTEATFVVDVSVPNPGTIKLNPEDGEPWFEEGWLPGGTQEDPGKLEKVIDLPTYELNGQTYSYTVDTTGWQDLTNGSFKLVSGSGYLIWDGSTLTYHLDKNAFHQQPANNDKLDETTNIKLIGKHDNKYDAELVLEIRDDAPEVTFTLAGNHDNYKSGHSYELNWDIEHGADGEAAANYSTLVVTVLDASGQPTSVSFTFADGMLFPSNHASMSLGSYGDIVWNSGTGKWEFKAAPNVEGKLKFELSGTDTDNDTTSQSIEVAITKPVGPPPGFVLGAEDSAANEGYLSKDPSVGQDNDGSMKGAGSTEIKLDTKGFDVDTTQGSWQLDSATGKYTLQGSNGYLTWDPNAASDKLTYTLTNSSTHNQGAGQDLIANDTGLGQVTLKDDYGNTWVVDTGIKIQDDAPLATCFVDPAPSHLGYYGSGMPVDGEWGVTHGADGQASSVHSVFRVDLGNGNFVEVDIYSVSFGTPITLSTNQGTNCGTVVFNSNGTFTYTPPANVVAKYTISIGGTDSDNDTRYSQNIVLDVKKPGWTGPITLEPANGEPVYESGLPDGTNNGSASTSQVLNLPAGCEPDLSFGGWSAAPGGKFELVNNNNTAKLVWDSANKTLSYELIDNMQHQAGGPASNDPGYKDGLVDLFDGFKVIDQYGNVHDMTATVEVKDDVPVVTHDTDNDSIKSGEVITGEITELEYGADGEGKLQVVITIGNQDHKFDITLGGPAVEIRIGGTYYGDLVLKADGTYSFDTQSNLHLQIGIAFEATDAEGDVTRSSTNNVNINKPTGISYIFGDDDGPANEAYLTEGTQFGQGSLTHDIAIKAGYTINTDYPAGAWNDEGGNVYKLQGDYGFLLYNKNTNTLTYTLENKATHGAEGTSADETVFDTFGGKKLVLTDNLNNDYTDPSDQVRIEIKIQDDAPEVSIGAAQGGGTTVTSGYDYEGAWSIEYGADGAAKNSGNAGDFITLSVRLGTQSSPVYELVVGQPQAVVIGGKTYGTITLNADNTYVFTAAPNTSGNFVFNLSGKDTDGDQRSGSFTLTVNSKTHPVGPLLPSDGEPPVSESLLPDGSGKPTNPGASLSTELKLPDDYSVDTSVGGWTFDSGKNVWLLEPNGKAGHLEYDAANNKLTYHLDDNLEHTAPGQDSTVESIPGITLKDDKGNSFTTEVQVKVEDDIPDVFLGDKTGVDSVIVGSGATYSDGRWSAEPGADGKHAEFLTLKVNGHDFGEITVGQGVEIVLNGTKYGTLTLNGDGSYSFVAEPNRTNTLNFELTAKDSEGDSSMDGFTITLQKPNPGITIECEAFESSLPGGSNEAASSLFEVKITPSGYTVDYSGWANPSGDNYVLYGKYGNLIYNAATGKLQYELMREAAHGAPKTLTDERLSDSFNGQTITLKDAAGNDYELALDVTVVDDTPVVSFNSPTTGVSGDVTSGAMFDGEYTMTFGADKHDPTNPITLEINLVGQPSVTLPAMPGAATIIEINGVKYGTLWLNTDGTFQFKAEPNITASLEFRLTLKDSDGDTATSDDPFTLNITKPTPPVTELTTQDNNPFSDANIVGKGTAADPGQATKPIDVPNGFKIDTTGWTSQGTQSNWNGDGFQVGEVFVKYHNDPALGNGYMSYYQLSTGEWRLTYTLTDPGTHTQQGIGANDVAWGTVGDIVLKDEHGNTWDVGTKFEIRDDQPVLKLDTNVGGVQSGGECSFDWGINHGADGPAAKDASVLKVVIADKNGIDSWTFTLKAEVGGSYELKDSVTGRVLGKVTFEQGVMKFEAAQNLEGKATFTLIGKDGDGDVVETSKAIDISFTPPPPDLTTKEAFDEAHIVAAESPKADYDGTDPDSTKMTQDVDIPVGYTLVIDSQWTLVSPGVYKFQGSNGYLLYDESTKKLTYTLEKPATTAVQGEDTFHDIMDLTFKHSSGGTTTGKVDISIKDDIPLSAFTNQGGGNQGTVDSGDEFSGKWDIAFGADGEASSDSMLIEFSLLGGGGKYSEVVTVGQAITVELNGVVYGTLTLNADKTYTFEAASNIANNTSIIVKLSGVDSEGDIGSSGNFTINIAAVGPPSQPYLGAGSEWNEANLFGGTDHDENALTQTVALDPGYFVVVAGDARWIADPDVSGGYMIKGTYGTLYLAADGRTMTYKLTGNIHNDGSDASKDDASGYDLIKDIVVTDHTGNNKWTLDGKFEIVDDEPAPIFGLGATYDVGSGEEFTTPVNPSAPHFNPNYGADGGDKIELLFALDGGTYASQTIAVGVPCQITIGGTYYGTIILNANNTFTFKAGPNIDSAKLNLKLQVTDRDGDVGTHDKPVIIEITKSGPPWPNDWYVGKGEFFDESALPGGTDYPGGTVTKDVALWPGLKIDITSGGWSETFSGSNIYTKSNASGQGTLTWNDITGKLTYTLQNAADHPIAGQSGANDILHELFDGLKLKDPSTGNSWSVDGKIEIRDDAPEVTGGTSSLLAPDADYHFVANGEFKPNFGADGPAGGNDYFEAEISFTYNTLGGGSSSGTTGKFLVPKDGTPIKVSTDMGDFTIQWDSVNNKFVYSFLATSGRKGDSQDIKFGVYDHDGDIGYSGEFKYTLTENVPNAVLNLDEGYLSYGSNPPGDHGSPVDNDDVTGTNPSGTYDGIVWDVNSLNAMGLKGDGNLDGDYDTITWMQDGNNLLGIADGQVVIRITPEFDTNGNFTGGMNAEILKPFDHTHNHPGGSENHGHLQGGGCTFDDKININASYTLTGKAGTSTSNTDGSVLVTVKDDAPFGNVAPGGTSSQDHEIILHEPPERFADVVLVMDWSGSMNSSTGVMHMGHDLARWQVMVKSVIELAQAYIDNGITANFTFINFGYYLDNYGQLTHTSEISANYQQVSAEELVSRFLPLLNSGSINAFNQIVMDWNTPGAFNDPAYGNTDFNSPSKDLITVLEGLKNTGNDKNVYFMSDGERNYGGVPQDWYDYYEQHHDEFDMHAIGMGSGVNDPATEYLIQMVGGESDKYIPVKDFDDLSDTLVELVDPVTGNLLENIGSADGTTLVSVEIMHPGATSWTGYQLTKWDAKANMYCTEEIVFGKGDLRLIIYQDGTYRLYGSTLTEDVEVGIRFSASDADGDHNIQSGDMTLKILDSKPIAYDNVATLDRTAEYDFAGNILKDPSPTGDVDLMVDKARLWSVEYNGNVVYFGDQFTVTIHVPGKGTLTVNRDGSYTFKCEGSYTNADVTFKYTIADRDFYDPSGPGDPSNTSSAELIVKYDYTKAYDNVATQSGPNSFAGNVMTDPSAHGQVDQVHSDTTLLSFYFNNQTYTFGSQSSITAYSPQGTLVMNKDGSYTFTVNNGVNMDDVALKVEYTLVNGEPGNSGTLYIQQIDPLAHDNVADTASGYLQPNHISNGLESTGWSHYGGGFTTGASISGLPNNPPRHEYLPRDNNWIKVSGAGAIDNNTLANDLFGFANANVLQAYLKTELGLEGNLYQSGGQAYGSFAIKEFSSSGGLIVFDWAFSSIQRSGEQDASFWVLRDKAGNIVASGLLSQLTSASSSSSLTKFSTTGVVEINLPRTATDMDYELVIGSVQVGADLYNTGSELYIGHIVAMEQEYHFSGNVLTDPGTDGAVDVLNAGSRLISIIYDGQELFFSGNNPLVIKTLSDGVLTIHNDGTYYYSDASGRDGSLVAEDFTYTVRDSSGGTDEAQLFVRGDQYHISGDGRDNVLDYSDVRGALLIEGGAGNDIIKGGTYDNVLLGGDGNDTIEAGGGNNWINGGAGNDHITGGSGNDTIYGGAGNDTILGGAGDDLIYGGAGNNLLDGGAGKDTFAWSHTTDLVGKDTILNFSTDEGDRLSFDDLLDNGGSLDAYLNNHIQNMTLNQGAGTFSFTIKEGAFEKAVEINFENNDAAFNNAVTAYNGASDNAGREAALFQLLQEISS